MSDILSCLPNINPRVQQPCLQFTYWSIVFMEQTVQGSQVLTFTLYIHACKVRILRWLRACVRATRDKYWYSRCYLGVSEARLNNRSSHPLHRFGKTCWLVLAASLSIAFTWFFMFDVDQTFSVCVTNTILDENVCLFSRDFRLTLPALLVSTIWCVHWFRLLF